MDHGELFLDVLSVRRSHSSGVVSTGQPPLSGYIMDLRYSLYIIMIIHTADVYSDQHSRVFSIRDQVSSCSGWLSTIIFNFCNNTYKIVKRDTSSLMIEKMSPKDLREDMKRRKLIAEGPWKRIRRQVASECCERPCTVADIIMYCPDDAKLLVENPDIFD